jgi:hypothetical protein
MQPNKITTIRYTKILNEDDVEITNRTVLITSVPGNIKAIDLTNANDDKRQKVEQAYTEYTEYLNAHMKIAFSFEDWLSHTKSVDFTPKWRSFKPEHTEVLS